jgi:hypothetical protein
MFCSYCGFKNSDDFNFCNSCGKARNDTSSNASNTKSASNQKIEFILRPKGVVLSLQNDKWDFDLCDVYKQMLGAKHFSDIIFDAIFTSKCVLIRPVSKAPAHMWLLGALITPGLAQTADLLGRKISSFLSANSDNLVGSSIDVEILSSFPTWSLSDLYEVKQSLPSIIKTASTILSFRGINNAKPQSSDTRLLLVFEGSATPSKKQFLEFSHVAKLCNFDISKIQKF